MIAISNTWNCLNCGQTSEAQFKRCWNCGADYEGRLDPHFKIESTPQPQTEKHVSWALGFAWLMGWVAFCTLVIAAAVVLESWLPRFWTVRLSLAAILLMICLLTAVFVNVLSRLYLWLRNYLDDDDQDARQVASGQHKPVQLKGPRSND